MAPMTTAERQRKYREKLKKEDPAKLEKLKKENAERIKKKYRTIKQLAEFKQKEHRKKWRQAKQKQKNEPKLNQTGEPEIDQKQKRKETEAHFKKCWNILKACEKNLNIASKNTSSGSQEMQTEVETETARAVKEEPTECCEDPLEQPPEETSVDALSPAPGQTRRNVYEEETPLCPSSRTSMSDDEGATSPNSVPERYLTKHSQDELAFLQEKYKRAQIREEELHQLKMEEQTWLVKAAEELYKKNSLEKEAAELKLKRLQST